MKFFTNFKVKKTKKDYETLLEFKDDLDSVSLKVSILNDRIINFKKTSSLSFDKMNDYINKIHASAKKNNISLCKKGFFKYCRENLIYNSILEHSEVISKEFLSVSDSLSNLQDIYLILESEFNQSINSSKISLKPFFLHL